LGTIIRIADWFGFRHIICNKGTVDVLNPKVLRASMGSFFRVNIEYVEDLAPILAEHSSQIRVADMEGETLAEAPLQGNEFILLGNEANGISDDAHPLKKITIHGKGGAESLNVGVAAGIFAYTLSQKHRI
jgi:TrmH family RNA methyltransferase